MRQWWISERKADASRRVPTIVRPYEDSTPPPLPYGSSWLHDPYIQVVERSGYDALLSQAKSLRSALEKYKHLSMWGDNTSALTPRETRPFAAEAVQAFDQWVQDVEG